MPKAHRILKRWFDIFFASLCLILFIPFGLIIALLIKVESKGPIIFTQKRAGLNGRSYAIYKFRSMRLHTETPEELGPIKHKHALVTRMGYIMRRLKIDELPQFLNVLFGQMSIVGPRPCLLSTFAKLNSNERARFSVRPGITGWAEVNGNVELTWQEQLALDLWYISHHNLILDLKIIYKTITTVFAGSKKNNENLRKARDFLRAINGIYL